MGCTRGLRNEGGRAFENELADDSVARAEQVDAEVAETVHHGVGVQVAAGESAGEEPRAVGSGASAQIRSRGEVCPYERGERFRNISGMLAEGDARTGAAVVDDAGRERDDLDQRLGVEEQEHPCDGVGE